MKSPWIVLLFLVFAGCTKFGKNISISGYVRNPVSGEYYADVKIKLMRTDGGLPGGYKDVKVVYTNADGYFELDHFGGYSNYYLGVDLTQDVHILGWFEDGEHVGDGRMNVKKGKPMQPVFEMVEFGNYSLDLNNVNCQGPNDTIIVNQQNQVGSFLDKEWIVTGCNGYTTAMDKVPMGWIYIQWTVIRNGISNSFSDEVFVGEGQEVTYTLDY